MGGNATYEISLYLRFNQEKEIQTTVVQQRCSTEYLEKEFGPIKERKTYSSIFGYSGIYIPADPENKKIKFPLLRKNGIPAA